MSAFIQKGTGTLVAGTATIPAMLINTDARITVTRNTPAGVLGAGGLDCPTAARTTAHFVVNSIDLAGALVATETSTFDWHVV